MEKEQADKMNDMIVYRKNTQLNSAMTLTIRNEG